MARFKLGDRILLLEKYARLYPATGGIVRSLNPNKTRELFDEYLVEFPTGTSKSVHAFQIVEDASAWRTLAATITGDASNEAGTGGAHTQRHARRMIVAAGQFELDVKMEWQNGRSLLLGQFRDKTRIECRPPSEARLKKEGLPI